MQQLRLVMATLVLASIAVVVPQGTAGANGAEQLGAARTPLAQGSGITSAGVGIEMVDQMDTPVRASVTGEGDALATPGPSPAQAAAGVEVPFDRVVIDPIELPQGHKPKAIGDVNGDGQADIIAHTAGEGLFWYAYPTWTRYQISGGGAGEQAQAIDIDNDGNLDVLVGGTNQTPRWYENPLSQGQDPATTLWSSHVIGGQASHDLEVADIDLDGNPDVFTQDGLYLQGDSTSWTAVSNSRFPGREGRGTALGDVDGDGDIDMVDLSSGQIVWYENPLPAAQPASADWTRRVITTGYKKNSIRIGDVNHDGRADVLLAPATTFETGPGLEWLEGPTDPKTGSWAAHLIDASVSGVHQSGVMLADIDGDQTTDVIVVEQEQSHDPRYGPYRFDNDRILVFYNTQRAALSWDVQQLASTGGHNPKIGDIDGDGDVDILTANHGYFGAPNPVELWRNQRNEPVLDTTAPSAPTDVSSIAVGPYQIDLAWTASTDDVGVAGYRVLRDGAEVGTTAGTTYADSGLQPSVAYTYEIVAFDAAGNASAPSSPASAVTEAAPVGSNTDDFDATSLDPAWTLVDPVGDATASLTAAPGHLQLAVPGGGTHDCWRGGAPSCTRLMRAAADIDGTFETRINGVNLTNRHQAYGLILWQDSLNFIRFEFWHDSSGTKTAAWQVIGGAGSNAITAQVFNPAPSNYLRVIRTGATFALERSTDGSNWTNAGSVSQPGLRLTQVGLQVGNISSDQVTANFDYFRMG